MSDGAGHLSLMPGGPWAGWLCWTDPAAGTFLDAIGQSYTRSDGPGRATVMLSSKPSHTNRLGSLHGGFLASFADHAYFAGLAALGMSSAASAVTVDLTMQYCGAGIAGPDLRAEVELLRETRRMAFMRLTIWQDDAMIAASTATIKKPSPST